MLRKAYIICAVAVVRITNRSATGRIRKTALKEIRPPSHDTYDEMSVLYEGKVIDMLDAESLCAVARFCVPTVRPGNKWKRATRPKRLKS